MPQFAVANEIIIHVSLTKSERAKYGTRERNGESSAREGREMDDESDDRGEALLPIYADKR